MAISSTDVAHGIRREMSVCQLIVGRVVFGSVIPKGSDSTNVVPTADSLDPETVCYATFAKPTFSTAMSSTFDQSDAVWRNHNRNFSRRAEPEIFWRC